MSGIHNQLESCIKSQVNKFPLLLIPSITQRKLKEKVVFYFLQ